MSLAHQISSLQQQVAELSTRNAELELRLTKLVESSDQRAVDKMKDEFVSVVSHEIRTPLASIRGSLGLLAGGPVGGEGGRLEEEGVRPDDALGQARGAAGVDEQLVLAEHVREVFPITRPSEDVAAVTRKRSNGRKRVNADASASSPRIT